MRTDKQLADALVEAGILDIDADSVTPYFMYVDNLYVSFETDEDALNDWRVAGSCMERYPTGFTYCQMEHDWMVVAKKGGPWFRNESLPRAIIEAYVEATDE